MTRAGDDSRPGAGGDRAQAILFVCTGNTCRSALAAAVAGQRLQELGLPWVAASAGVAAHEDSPASDTAIAVARQAGLDLSQHRARLVTRQMVLQAVLLLALVESQRRFIRRLAPEVRERVHGLRAYATRGAEHGEVADPIGGDAARYRRTLEEIRALVDESLQRWSEEVRGRRR